MARSLAIGLRQVPGKDEYRGEVEDEGVIKAIDDPRPERMHLEEQSLL